MAQSFLNRADLPIGLRNNNVGNLRPSSRYKWQGEIGENGGFVVFEDVAWGIRAFITNFHSSITRYNTDTIRKYISRYAPEEDNNDTEGYIRIVSQETGVAPDAPIPQDAEFLRKLLRVQMKMENGQEYATLITDDDINEAFSRLSSPVATFFNAVGVYYRANTAKVNVAVIGLVIVGVGAWIYYLKKIKKV
jgi:hypothetical protein